MTARHFLVRLPRPHFRTLVVTMHKGCLRLNLLFPTISNLKLHVKKLTIFQPPKLIVKENKSLIQELVTCIISIMTYVHKKFKLELVSDTHALRYLLTITWLNENISTLVLQLGSVFTCNMHETKTFLPFYYYTSSSYIPCINLSQHVSLVMHSNLIISTS